MADLATQLLLARPNLKMKVFATAVAVAGAGALCLAVLRNVLTGRGISAKWLVDLMIHRTAMFPAVELRRHFASMPYRPAPMDLPKSHAQAAAERNWFRPWVTALAALEGMRVRFLQGSGEDLNAGGEITRAYHWSKDYVVPPHRLDLQFDGVYALRDVDYYLPEADLGALLSRGKTVVLYTFAPPSVAGQTEDVQWTWVATPAGAARQVTVAGGRTYTHPVWDWGGDSFMYHGWSGSTSYLVERRQATPTHALVLLVPVARWSWYNPMRLFLCNAQPLRRLEPIVDTKRGPWVVCDYEVGSDEHTWTRSVCRPGSYACATVPREFLDDMRHVHASSSVDIQTSTIEARLKKAELDVGTSTASILCDYVRSTNDKVPPLVISSDVAAGRFQFVKPKEPTVEARPGMVPIMAPLTLTAMTPDICYMNSVVAVKERVERLQAEVGPARLAPQKVELMSEFINHLRHVDEQGDYGAKLWPYLEPLTTEEVVETLHRPTQLRIYELGGLGEASARRLRTFMKRETYNATSSFTGKHPRVISTTGPWEKNEYSRFTLALAAAVARCKWYAFKRDPAEIAERVATILADAMTALETDYHRFDGSFKELARGLEHMLMLEMFGPNWRAILLKLLARQHHREATMAADPGDEPIDYDTLWSRLSGSPETSVFNTIFNAFICYCALRRQVRSIGGLPEFRHLLEKAVFGGDDGLIADLDPGALVFAANSLGHRIETKVHRRVGDDHVCPSVKFLSRIYGPDVWFGDSNNCADIARALSKLHLTTSLRSTTPEMRLLEKCVAIMHTDAETPILSDFAKAVITASLQVNEENVDTAWSHVLEDGREVSWWAQFDSRFPNRQADWMLSLVEAIGFNYLAFRDWLTRVPPGQAGLDYLRAPPLFTDLIWQPEPVTAVSYEEEEA